MKLNNIKQSPITTIIGVVLIAFFFFLFIAPMFFEVKKDYTAIWWVPWLFLISGGLFIISPDTIVFGARKIINRTTVTIEEKKDESTN